MNDDFLGVGFFSVCSVASRRPNRLLSESLFGAGADSVPASFNGLTTLRALAVGISTGCSIGLTDAILFGLARTTGAGASVPVGAVISSSSSFGLAAIGEPEFSSDFDDCSTSVGNSTAMLLVVSTSTSIDGVVRLSVALGARTVLNRLNNESSAGGCTAAGCVSTGFDVDHRGTATVGRSTGSDLTVGN